MPTQQNSTGELAGQVPVASRGRKPGQKSNPQGAYQRKSVDFIMKLEGARDVSENILNGHYEPTKDEALALIETARSIAEEISANLRKLAESRPTNGAEIVHTAALNMPWAKDVLAAKAAKAEALRLKQEQSKTHA